MTPVGREKGEVKRGENGEERGKIRGKGETRDVIQGYIRKLWTD